MRQHYVVGDTRVNDPRTLVFRGEGNWVEPRPVRCPVGHVLANRQVTAGWVPCKAPGRTGHRTHQCDCGEVVYTPDTDEYCHCEKSRPVSIAIE